MSSCRSWCSVPSPAPPESARTSCSARSAYQSGSIIVLRSCRAVSSSASRSRAHLPTSRRWFSPTSRPGNLDEHTADIVFAEFLNLVRGEGSAALVATHNERLAAKMDRVVRLHEGQLD